MQIETLIVFFKQKKCISLNNELFCLKFYNHSLFKSIKLNALLHIQTGFKNNKTYLKKAYYTTPFKLANITEDKNQPVLQLMLRSSSPGILDEDNYNLKVELDENCSLRLQTQSYQRLFEMKKGASQNVEVFLDKMLHFVFCLILRFPAQSI